MKRKVAIISDHASPLAELGSVDSGGQNIYVSQVAQNLARSGYQVDVFTRRSDESLPEIYEWKENLRVVYVPAGPPQHVPKEDLLGYMTDFTEYMIEYFKNQDQPYDLVHANFWMSGLVAAEIKAALGTPFVITFHALGRVRRLHQKEADKFPDQRFEIEDYIVRTADGIIAECPQDREDLMYLYDAEPARIIQIPCGFDPHEVWRVEKTEARRRIGIPQDERLVLQLGRMVPRKGVDIAIRAFARLIKDHRIPARMIIVGGEARDPDPALTPEIARLQEIARQEGVVDRVLFTGSRTREEIKYYFSAADVFISTPWYEPFGITPLEAMACGAPVIGSNVGGIKYTVADGETGFLVPPQDPEAVAQRLVELFQDPPKLERFSNQAIRWVYELFTWDKVVDRLSDYYEHVLEKILQKTSCQNIFVLEDQDEQRAAIERAFATSLEVFQQTRVALGELIVDAASVVADCLDHGGKILVCGNGGSAADAQHFAAELVGRFMTPGRRALPVIALTADSAILTAWSNDIGYETIFSRQVEALGRPGDLLLGISTSGRSTNLIEAFKAARALDITCIGLLGNDGGDLLPMSDIALVVPSASTPRIQEAQMLVLHLLCELVEQHVNSLQLVPDRNLAQHAHKLSIMKDLNLIRKNGS